MFCPYAFAILPAPIDMDTGRLRLALLAERTVAAVARLVMLFTVQSR
jgi:hypothetical protein